MSVLGDATDAGLLLAWASRPRDVPARHEEYHRLVVRYRNDPDFAAVVDSVFSGAGMSVVIDERDGAVVIADVSSPLRVTAGDIMKRAQPYHRAVIGAVILAVARTAYPYPPSMARVAEFRVLLGEAHRRAGDHDAALALLAEGLREGAHDYAAMLPGVVSAAPARRRPRRPRRLAAIDPRLG